MKKKSIVLGLLLSAALLAACTDDAGSIGGAGETVILEPAEGGSGPGDNSGSIEKDPEEPPIGAEDPDNPDNPIAAGGRKEDGEMLGNSVSENLTVAEAGLEKAVSGRELMCLIGNEEEARKIAQQYGITFVEFDNGVATFTTAEDLQAVIQRGKDNGYHSIEINQEIILTDPVAPTAGYGFSPRNSSH